LAVSAAVQWPNVKTPANGQGGNRLLDIL
jgi:hypothetical protein